MELFLFQLVIYSTIIILSILTLKLLDRKHKREKKKVFEEFNKKYECERLDRNI